jgi:hypothetical protein|tara:strand:- start:123 stop:590 length:468 start_codon:yes stop_codon:yes gene_type:complete
MNDFVDLIEPNYQLAICELYHPYFHGTINDDNIAFKKYLYNSYLCFSTIDRAELYDQELYPTDNTGPWGLSIERMWPNVKHPSIRNYSNIVKKYKLEIVQMVYLNTGHHICIPKTFWLKVFQRKYKKHYKKLQERIRRAKHPKALFQRQLTGKRF